MRISDWSSDVCSSDLASDFDVCADRRDLAVEDGDRLGLGLPWVAGPDLAVDEDRVGVCLGAGHGRGEGDRKPGQRERQQQESVHAPSIAKTGTACVTGRLPRSEEHTSELQTLMRNSYAVYCLQHTQY